MWEGVVWVRLEMYFVLDRLRYYVGSRVMDAVPDILGPCLLQLVNDIAASASSC